MDGVSTSDSYSDEETDWISTFLSQSSFRQLLVEVPDVFFGDNLALCGLDVEVKHFNDALRLIRNQAPTDLDVDTASKAAALLYARAHARYVLTPQGLEDVRAKYERCDYGRCPRYLCGGQRMLPYGAVDRPGKAVLRFFCPCCHQLYKNFVHTPDQFIDGCFYGPNLAPMFLLTYPTLLPRNCPKYEPRIYGFAIYDPEKRGTRINPVLRDLMEKDEELRKHLSQCS